FGTSLPGPVPGADGTSYRQRYSSPPQRCGSAPTVPTVGGRGGRTAPPGVPPPTGALVPDGRTWPHARAHHGTPALHLGASGRTPCIAAGGRPGELDPRAAR